MSWNPDFWSVFFRQRNDGPILDEKLKFAVERWCLWEPQAGAPVLCSRYSGGLQTSETLEKPDLATVPAMQRRRLGTLARSVFHVLSHCADPGAQEPAIFSSHMGEIGRTQGIVDTLAADEPVSPASFSLSVHNAIAGQWSLIRGIKAPMIALAPPANSPVPALFEAAGILLEEEHEAVNVVFYDEPYPSFYSPFITGPAAATALALRLVVAGDEQREDLLYLRVKRLSALGIASGLRANFSALADLLVGRHHRTRVVEDQCTWQLERCL